MPTVLASTRIAIKYCSARIRAVPALTSTISSLLQGYEGSASNIFKSSTKSEDLCCLRKPSQLSPASLRRKPSHEPRRRPARSILTRSGAGWGTRTPAPQRGTGLASPRPTRLGEPGSDQAIRKRAKPEIKAYFERLRSLRTLTLLWSLEIGTFKPRLPSGYGGGLVSRKSRVRIPPGALHICFISHYIFTEA